MHLKGKFWEVDVRLVEYNDGTKPEVQIVSMRRVSGSDTTVLKHFSEEVAQMPDNTDIKHLMNTSAYSIARRNSSHNQSQAIVKAFNALFRTGHTRLGQVRGLTREQLRNSLHNIGKIYAELIGVVFDLPEH